MHIMPFPEGKGCHDFKQRHTIDGAEGRQEVKASEDGLKVRGVKRGYQRLK